LIKAAIVDPIETAKGLVDTAVQGIKSLLSFAGLLGTVQGIFNSIKDAIVNPIRAARDTVAGIVDSIKNKIGSIPGSGAISGAIGKLTGGGGIFLGAQQRIIGEAGREAVIPLDRPLGSIDPSVREMAATLRGIRPGGGVTNYWNITETNNAEETAHKVLNRMLVNAA